MPKTLEEALALITKLTADNAKILSEKKEMSKLFEEKEKEEMTDTERKMAEILEREGTKRTELEQKLDAERSAREAMAKEQADKEQARITKSLEERIGRIAKGDAEVAKKLQANIGLLKDLPKATEEELTTAVNLAYNMMGTGSVNPLTATSSTGGQNSGEPGGEVRFSETSAGKALGNRLGLSSVQEGDKK